MTNQQYVVFSLSELHPGRADPRQDQLCHERIQQQRGHRQGKPHK